MPRKSPYERLVCGIARTRKQVGKLGTRIASESDALFLIDRQLEDLQQRLAGNSNLTNLKNLNVQQVSFDFKGVKRELKAIKRRSKPVLSGMKEERRRERAMKKEERSHKKVLLEEARLNALPQQSVRIIVDGWNVMGALLKGRGRSKGKMTSFLNELASDPISISRGYKVSVIFDGRGRDGKDDLIFVRHSGSEMIADDVLVNEFGILKDRGIDCGNAMVVTSDRELTLRLHALGVLVMKSGTFVRLVREIISPQEQNERVEEDDGDDDVVMVNIKQGDDDDDEEQEDKINEENDSSSESSDEEE